MRALAHCRPCIRSDTSLRVRVRAHELGVFPFWVIAHAPKKKFAVKHRSSHTIRTQVKLLFQIKDTSRRQLETVNVIYLYITLAAHIVLWMLSYDLGVWWVDFCIFVFKPLPSMSQISRDIYRFSCEKDVRTPPVRVRVFETLADHRHWVSSFIFKIKSWRKNTVRRFNQILFLF